mmetsp:Transcript_22409/g.45314  ORF Transcript_22409/g.45314 Transcript_22409/m.45314 type:complete len:259 (+) Transcript_22409:1734-2510(+)
MVAGSDSEKRESFNSTTSSRSPRLQSSPVSEPSMGYVKASTTLPKALAPVAGSKLSEMTAKGVESCTSMVFVVKVEGMRSGATAMAETFTERVRGTGSWPSSKAKVPLPTSSPGRLPSKRYSTVKPGVEQLKARVAGSSIGPRSAVEEAGTSSEVLCSTSSRGSAADRRKVVHTGGWLPSPSLYAQAVTTVPEPPRVEFSMKGVRAREARAGHSSGKHSLISEISTTHTPTPHVVGSFSSTHTSPSEAPPAHVPRQSG